MIILQLIWAFFKIGLFSIGGGYAALPQIHNIIVDGMGWLTQEEFADVLTLSQMTPGPIALNAATFVGTKVAGLPGAIAATFGNVLPSIIIVLALALFYSRYRNLKGVKGVLNGLRPAVVAMITVASLAVLFLALFPQGIPQSIGAENVTAFIMVALGFFLLRVFKLDPIFVILGSGGVGVLLHFIVK